MSSLFHLKKMNENENKIVADFNKYNLNITSSTSNDNYSYDKMESSTSTRSSVGINALKNNGKSNEAFNDKCNENCAINDIRNDNNNNIENKENKENNNSINDNNCLNQCENNKIGEGQFNKDNNCSYDILNSFNAMYDQNFINKNFNKEKNVKSDSFFCYDYFKDNDNTLNSLTYHKDEKYFKKNENNNIYNNETTFTNNNSIRENNSSNINTESISSFNDKSLFKNEDNNFYIMKYKCDIDLNSENYLENTHNTEKGNNTHSIEEEDNMHNLNNIEKESNTNINDYVNDLNNTVANIYNNDSQNNGYISNCINNHTNNGNIIHTDSSENSDHNYNNIDSGSGNNAHENHGNSSNNKTALLNKNNSDEATNTDHKLSVTMCDSRNSNYKKDSYIKSYVQNANNTCDQNLPHLPNENDFIANNNSEGIHIRKMCGDDDEYIENTNSFNSDEVHRKNSIYNENYNNIKHSYFKKNNETVNDNFFLKNVELNSVNNKDHLKEEIAQKCEPNCDNNNYDNSNTIICTSNVNKEHISKPEENCVLSNIFNEKPNKLQNIPEKNVDNEIKHNGNYILKNHSTFSYTVQKQNYHEMHNLENKIPNVSYSSDIKTVNNMNRELFISGEFTTNNDINKTDKNVHILHNYSPSNKEESVRKKVIAPNIGPIIEDGKVISNHSENISINNIISDNNGNYSSSDNGNTEKATLIDDESIILLSDREKLYQIVNEENVPINGTGVCSYYDVNIIQRNDNITNKQITNDTILNSECIINNVNDSEIINNTHTIHANNEQDSISNNLSGINTLLGSNSLNNVNNLKDNLPNYYNKENGRVLFQLTISDDATNNIKNLNENISNPINNEYSISDIKSAYIINNINSTKLAIDNSSNNIANDINEENNSITSNALENKFKDHIIYSEEDYLHNNNNINSDNNISSGNNINSGNVSNKKNDKNNNNNTNNNNNNNNNNSNNNNDNNHRDDNNNISGNNINNDNNDHNINHEKYLQWFDAIYTVCVKLDDLCCKLCTSFPHSMNMFENDDKSNLYLLKSTFFKHDNIKSFYNNEKNKSFSINSYTLKDIYNNDVNNNEIDEDNDNTSSYGSRHVSDNNSYSDQSNGKYAYLNANDKIEDKMKNIKNYIISPMNNNSSLYNKKNCKNINDKEHMKDPIANEIITKNNFIDREYYQQNESIRNAILDSYINYDKCSKSVHNKNDKRINIGIHSDFMINNDMYHHNNLDCLENVMNYEKGAKNAIKIEKNMKNNISKNTLELLQMYNNNNAFKNEMFIQQNQNNICSLYNNSSSGNNLGDNVNNLLSYNNVMNQITNSVKGIKKTKGCKKNSHYIYKNTEKKTNKKNSILNRASTKTIKNESEFEYLLELSDKEGPSLDNPDDLKCDVAGVYWDKRSWIASWYDNGKRYYKSFSAKTHGFYKSKFWAIKVRLSKVKGQTIFGKNSRKNNIKTSNNNNALHNNNNNNNNNILLNNQINHHNNCIYRNHI